MITPIRKKAIIISVVVAIIIVALALILYFVLRDDSKEVRFRGAIVSNGLGCADIGRSMFEKDGTVVDAAIATLLCDGLSNPQSMGLGGGFLATLYIKSTGETISLVARESAPLAATEDMFVNKTVSGGLAAGVPGEIKGYQALHKKYGRLSWAELIEPSIKLCEEGQIVSGYLAVKLKEYEATIQSVPSLKEIFVDPRTGQVYKEGDKIKRPQLGATLRIIAKEGEDAIYNGGVIGKMLAEDIQGHGGIITEQDLKEYNVRWVKPATTRFRDYTVYTAPSPGSGPVLNLMLNLIQNHVTSNDEVMWHRIIESFKHAYGLRTKLGDIEFLPDIQELVANMSSQSFADELYHKINDDWTVNNYTYYGAEYATKEDHGTASMSVVAPNGDAITVTSTINGIFGAQRVSQQTGIILNNEMDDFSTPGKVNDYNLPPSPSNFIKPKKMPLSSMVPTVIVDKHGNPRLLIGAAGGTKITTSVAQAIFRHLIQNDTLEYAIHTPRLHHQLSPMQVQHETNFDQAILSGLEKRGHPLREIPPENGFSAVTGISVYNENRMESVYDPRRKGSTAFYP